MPMIDIVVIDSNVPPPRYSNHFRLLYLKPYIQLLLLHTAIIISLLYLPPRGPLLLTHYFQALYQTRGRLSLV
jgi:hypothetical protein